MSASTPRPRRILFALGTRREALVVHGGRPRSNWRQLLQPQLVKDGAEHRADGHEAASAAGSLVEHGASVLLGVG